MVLSKLKGDAERYLGKEVGRAVITVPVPVSILVLMHPVLPPEMVVLSAYVPMETNWHR